MATKAEARLPRVELLHVATPTGLSGRLTKASQHSFTYDTFALGQANRGFEISLTMPLRPESYSRALMLPVFQTFLPEGFLKDRIVERFGKVMRVDDMALLALSGENAIGRLRLSRDTNPGPGQGDVESLSEILQDHGSRDLFKYLSDKYLIRSGISGVQPKVMLAAENWQENSLPEARLAPPSKASIGERATLRARQLIVKVGGDDFPGLAENEYHCLTIARALGLPVPAFWLSADRKRLVIERFDFDHASGRYLGFEDMVSLQGLVNDRKYEGSYESVAKAITANSTSTLKNRSLEEFFASLVLSIVLQNGDAHLKNFGLLYTDPGSDDCRLAPVYDIVCTTVYIPKDRLALSLSSARDWPDRKTLCAFGRTHCLIDHPERVVDRTLDVVGSYVPDGDGAGIWARIRERAMNYAFVLAQSGRMARP
jgi:serine/threonine-protein kinase HipA